MSLLDVLKSKMYYLIDVDNQKKKKKKKKTSKRSQQKFCQKIKTRIHLCFSQ